MKLLFIILFSVLSTSILSQDVEFKPRSEKDRGKPSLFTKEMPSKSVTNISILEDLMNKEVGENVNILIIPGMDFKGKVKSVFFGATHKTISIQSQEINSLRLNISRINNNESFQYRGIMLSVHHKDMLILEKHPDIEGMYYWKIIDVAELMQD